MITHNDIVTKVTQLTKAGHDVFVAHDEGTYTVFVDDQQMGEANVSASQAYQTLLWAGL